MHYRPIEFLLTLGLAHRNMTHYKLEQDMLTCLNKICMNLIRRCAKPTPNYILHINLLK